MTRRKAASHGRRFVSLALILIGLVVLSYVGLQYASMLRAQRQLAREWARQEEAAHAAPARTRGSKDSLTRITIPRISLDAVVVEGTSRQQLLLGPGHMERTAAPGEAGNAVITAHRDTFFRHIYELSKGDVVELRRNGNLYRYEVTGKKIVTPED